MLRYELNGTVMEGDSPPFVLGTGYPVWSIVIVMFFLPTFYQFHDETPAIVLKQIWPHSFQLLTFRHTL
jgi:hypothetical protein